MTLNAGIFPSIIKNGQTLNSLHIRVFFSSVYLLVLGGSLVAQRVKCLFAVRETWFDPWRRKWQPTPVFLAGEYHGQRNLAGYSPWGHKESDTTEQLHFNFFFLIAVFVISCELFYQI